MAFLDSVMDAHGNALLDYLNGETENSVLLHRNDGFTYPPIPAKVWFYEDGFPELDQIAMGRCSGRISDLGAAAGSHALALQAEGLDRFLRHLKSLLNPGGQLVTDSIDPRHPTDESYKRYIEQKTAQGGYFGERTLRFEYKGSQSEWFEWMHIDPETLEQHVRQAGLGFEMIASESRRYLALIKKV